MKKSIKICLILGVVFTFLGIGITVSAAAMGARLNGFPYGFDFDYVRSHDWSVFDIQNNTESSVFYDIKTLELDIDEGSVEILEADEGTAANEITIYTDSPHAKVRIEQSATTLRIKSKMKNRFVLWNKQPSHIKIVVPKGYEFDKTEMDFGAVECYVDFLYSKQLELEAGVGDVTINDGRIENLETSGGVGSLDFQGEISGNTSIENGVGNTNFLLTGSQENFNYKVECGIGNVTVGDKSYSGLARENQVDNHANQWIDIECGVGNVSIQFVEEER